MRTVRGNQQTAINRGKIHRYLSLGTGTGFLTLREAGRTPSFYSNIYKFIATFVCAWTLVSAKREMKMGI